MCKRAIAQWSATPGAPYVPSKELTGVAPSAASVYRPLQRIWLTAEAARLLFSEYAEHRRTERGNEETGWVLLGRRDADEATVLATLPAGAEREADEAHIRFNSMAQALASRIVRQVDRRLAMLGIVHTHPGSLRHPSDGDYRGDIQWVGQLRGQEGIFGIGTSDGKFAHSSGMIEHPRPNLQALEDMSFAWYSLRSGSYNYEPIAVGVVPGPDLAAPLRKIWRIIEEHAIRLERLAKQQAQLRFDIDDDPALRLTLPLAEAGNAVRVLLSEKEVKYYLVRDGVLAADLYEPCVDRGVYRMLAELAGD